MTAHSPGSTWPLEFLTSLERYVFPARKQVSMSVRKGWSGVDKITMTWGGLYLNGCSTRDVNWKDFPENWGQSVTHSVTTWCLFFLGFFEREEKWQKHHCIKYCSKHHRNILLISKNTVLFKSFSWIFLTSWGKSKSQRAKRPKISPNVHKTKTQMCVNIPLE